MYCPHCGREMSLIKGVPTCLMGDMPLSRDLHAALIERFPAQRTRPVGIKVGLRLARWFCPGCGVPLAAELSCPECGHNLRDLFFQLVDLHPHRDERGN